MTECVNETLRDLLPALARNALPAAEASLVRAHLSGCAPCAAEWRILQAASDVFAASTPTVDVAAIVSRLPAPPAPPAPQARPALRVERGGAATRWRPSRSMFAAAASLTLVATLSLTVLRPIFFGQAPGVASGTPMDGMPDSAPVVVAPATTASAALVGTAELAELGVDELSTLLAELEQMEATIATEPTSWREPVTDIPGGQ